MEWGWREVSSILRRGESPAVRPARCWLLPAPGHCTGQTWGESVWDGELIPKAAVRGGPVGRCGGGGCGGVKVGARGDARAPGRGGPAPFWMRLNSWTRRHRRQIENVLFPGTRYRLFFSSIVELFEATPCTWGMF